MDYATKASGQAVDRPTRPGRPWAVSPPEGLPQEARPEPGRAAAEPEVPPIPTDTETPIAPPPAEPPELPTRPENPADPTVPVDLTTDDPVVELPPEGMLRVSLEGEDDQFVYPCHADRWAEAGWTVHPPVSIKEDGDGDPGDGGDPGGGGSPYPPGSPTITSIDPVPDAGGKAEDGYVVGGAPLDSVVIGTGFEPTSTLSAATPYGLCLKDVQVVDATTMHFTFDASLIPAAVEIPIWATNSFGGGDFFLLAVTAAPDPVAPTAAPTITQIQPLSIQEVSPDPWMYGCSEPATPSVVTGTGFEASTQLLAGSGYEATVLDLEFVDSTTLHFTFDTSGIIDPVEVPFTASNTVGMGALYFVPVVAWDLLAAETQAASAEPEQAGAEPTEPEPGGSDPAEAEPAPVEPAPVEPEASAEPPDYGSMTKAQIVAEVEATYGVTLDSTQTKAELIEQAEALAAEDAATAPEPGADAPAAEPDTSIPSDLLA